MDILGVVSSLLTGQKTEPAAQGQSVVQNLLMPKPSIEDLLYDAFQEAETGSFNNPWIRTTHQPEGGSTAFGPVQITQTKAMDYAGIHPNGRKKAVLSDESVAFVRDVLVPMQSKMSKYGGKDMKPGFEAYDYGGTGNFDVEQYAKAYEKLAKEMLLYDYQQSGKDIKKTTKSWRGVDNDERYNKIILKRLKNIGEK